ncbi:dynein heavy chain 5 axonemal [Clonorchis sinensis]|uniref:Dynein heavy chain 5 axonemal n=1 Tax=Clonorchis sinensis TaxID=79923 RepID=G7YSQ6_CLOSI|nr:dynein heavy chain 5 axonemal [Clonorchis sinensis]
MDPKLSFSLQIHQHLVCIVNGPPNTTPEPDERFGTQGRINQPTKISVRVTDEIKDPIHDRCAIFIRNDNTFEVQRDKMINEIIFMTLDLTKGVLKCMEELFSSIILPQLQQMSDHPQADKSLVAAFNKDDLVDNTSNFLDLLCDASNILDTQSSLKPASSKLMERLSQLTESNGYHADPQLVMDAETCALTWISQLEQVLAISDQIRKEPGNTGPRIELDYWRRRMATFKCLLIQIQQPACKSVIALLQAARSHNVKRWSVLEAKVTNYANEAKDNLKFLYALEEYCEPLYRSDPVSMVECLPKLVNIIQLIYNISTYYNTAEKIASLFIKVTNQMITACRQYITNRARDTVWTQSPKDLLKKIHDSCHLNEAYQATFHQVKSAMEESDCPRKFDLSEMHVFGKFNLFCRRLRAIEEAFRLIELYARLKASQIEGLDPLIAEYNAAVNDLKKIPHDMLDPRLSQAAEALDAFRQRLTNIQANLKSNFENNMEKIPSVMRALQVLQQYKNLKLPELDVESAYFRVLRQYSSELTLVANEYKRHKEDPPILWDMPPVSGRIAWARQLYRRIEEPMMIFKDHNKLMRTKEAREITKRYNRLAETLVKFEVLHFRNWLTQVPTIKAGLRNPLLTQDEVSYGLSIALDQNLLTLYREIDLLTKYGMTVPQAVSDINRQGIQIKHHYSRLKLMLREISQLDSMLDPQWVQLMRLQFATLQTLLKPGLTLLNWTSLGIDQYIDDVSQYIDQMKLLATRARNLCQNRIETVLEEMTRTNLCELPKVDYWSIDQFAERTKSLCAKAGKTLQLKSQLIQTAVYELIDMLSGDYQQRLTQMAEAEKQTKREQPVSGDAGIQREIKTASGRTASTITHTKEARCKKRIDEAARRLLDSYHHRFVDTLLRVVRNTLENLRKHLMAPAHRVYDATGSSGERDTYFFCEAYLSLPNITIQPSVEYMQNVTNGVIQQIVLVTDNVTKWDLKLHNPSEFKVITEEGENNDGEVHHPRRRSANAFDANEAARRISALSAQTDQPYDDSQTYFKKVSENKEVTKLRAMLTSVFSSAQKGVNEQLRLFEHYSYLWRKSCETEIKAFEETACSLLDYETVFAKYDAEMKKVEDEPEVVECSPLAIGTEHLKTGLIAELEQWKLQYGRSCNQLYGQQMFDLFALFEKYEKLFTRPVKDLDDIRIMMTAIKELRDVEVDIDRKLGPIEDSYTLLSKYRIPVDKGEFEKADTLRYSWEKLSQLMSTAHEELIEIQPKYRAELLESVAQLKEDCVAFFEDYDTVGPMAPNISPGEASDRLIIFQNRFDSLYRQYVTCSAGEELFGLPATEYPRILQVRRELSLLQKLYSLYNSVLNKTAGYRDILWADVKIDLIAAELADLENRCLKLPSALRDYQAYEDLRKMLADFNQIMPLLELMTNPAMRPRHWVRLKELTGHEFNVEAEGFALRNILMAPLLKYKEDVEDVCISAIKEREIENKLHALKLDWNTQEFQFVHFKNRGELLLRGDHTNELVSLMEDSLMLLASLLSNRYNAPFRKEIQTMISGLSSTSEIIEQWLALQNLWIYLEAVFIGGDIARQLPREAKRFSAVDKSWQRIMQRAHETTNVLNCCTGDDLLNQLIPHCMEQLEICQKSLTGYLEKKRLLFPRFFFVSDPTLLEILGQASNPRTIQAHLLSVFDNIKTVRFHDKQPDTILTCYSQEGEVLELEQPVKAEGHVEVWLNVLLKQAQHSLHEVIHNAYMAVSSKDLNLLEFLDAYPAQVGLLGIQFIWTRDATIALKTARYEPGIMRQTDAAFSRMLTTLINETTKNLSTVERTKYETLITIHLHQKDIFSELVKDRIRSDADFEWLKQTRFYFFEETEKCLISITDVDFEYQNEFLGCTERLAITPLTDRCYITLAQALGMSMGGSPAGPAGTGKTETVKDMGRCLGKYVIVSNCSDQMDFRGLGRIFKGLAQSGAWGCFDEFNRIELPVLSVAAQQIAIVLTCKKERKSQFIFTDGDTVEMNPEFGIFLTMNPGYAGRQELPENLKINFRTVAMMVPDRQIIIRVKLASSGFNDNIILAQKFYTLYKLCEEQLSKQVHYDFGLRNILSVLRTLGAVKRANLNDTEFITVMRVLRDMNLSKLVGADEPLFMSLLNDLFPGLTLDKGGYPELEAAIRRHLEETSLISHPPWLLKVVQLYETQRVRHGMMVLGPSGTGKTCCIHALMKAMSECFEPRREMRMNPKAITSAQMFGKLDVATNDWTDGIFSALWRRTLKSKKGEHVWLVLDGPVDALWIENLNSVLDDSKLLTLANGDRIPMATNCKIMFEVDNIDNATPATVSRNGMVYISTSTLSWEPLLQGWLLSRPKKEADSLLELFRNSYSALFQYASRHLNFKTKVLEAFVVRQACDVLTGILPSKDEKERPPITQRHLARLYAFAILWSIGALLELDDRGKLESFIRQHDSIRLDLPPLSPGSNDSAFDFLVSEAGEWIHWSTRVEEFVYPPDHTPEYSSLLVPNVDNVRTEFLIDIISKQVKSVLLIGEQGTAKTVIINKYLSRYDPEFHETRTMNFSSVTTPNLIQKTIESFVDKRLGNTYGPPAGRKMTVFFDDISMPVVNEWGDQVGNEIVRQLIEMNGFYNLHKPGDFTSIVDVQFLAAMIHPGAGRNDIPERLKRQFAIFNCTLPSNNSIDKIFGLIAFGHFGSARGFSNEIQQLISRLVPTTRILWHTVKGKMLPTPAKFHYIFNLRDLSRIWQGMISTTADIINTPNRLIDLWRHECHRVLADRFTKSQDHAWFNSTIKRIVDEELGADYSSMLTDDQPYFVNFLRDPPEPTGDEPEDYVIQIPRIYEPITSFQQLNTRILTFLKRYNETIRGASMDLVLFEDAVTQIVRISRILYMPKGHTLLVGVGGSGKQSLTRLASFIAGYQTHQITLTRSYNVNNLIEDLKILYRTAGQKGKGITFLFTDQEIKDEAFLEYLNNMLSSGVISNLFARDEMDEICQELIPVMKKEFPRRAPTNENLQAYFYARTRHNLHISLCFSPVGEKFRTRALKFPGLFSGCTIIWFHRWPREALVAVADHYLSNFPLRCHDGVKAEIINSMGGIHDGVAESCTEYFLRFRRPTHVTPKSYLSFLAGYKDVYKQQFSYFEQQVERMNGGLTKLVEAQESVAQLKNELIVREKELEMANKEAEEVLQTVTIEQQASTEIRNKVQVVKDRAQTIVDEIDRERTVAEAKLEAAKPALLEAAEALNTIKPADIATVRRLGKPPNLIMRIMDCVLLLFQRHLEPYKPDMERMCPRPSWSESLKFMTNTGFLQLLMTFPKDTINEETVELLEPYLTLEDYTLDVATKVCGNVAGLLSWTRAMSSFYSINKDVLPMKDNLVKLEARLTRAMRDLQTAQETLDEKERELAKVQAVYEEALRKKRTLTDNAEQCRRKMTAASTLIGSLGEEQVRWTEQSKSFEQQITSLVGDVLVATAFLSYCGPFNQEFRQTFILSWLREVRIRRIPGSPSVNLISMLTVQTQLGEWNLQGLPTDELSIQNGIIVDKASRYPLLIDPQGQGKQWIKNRERTKGMVITTLWNKYFRQHLEDTLSTGRPLLIEDVGEELDPVLDNVLEKNFIKQGSIHKVKVGDKEVDVLKGFKLYITTKLANPTYTPEISARTSIIDFAVTMKGLEDQLLGRVIQSERQELESQRIQLMEDVQANKTKIKELEDNLLIRLASVQGSLVDDVDLIDVLNSTKSTAADVSQKLLIASETEMQINAAREEYRPIATRGSVLYFLIVEMSLVNCMYQISLRQFSNLFDLSLEESEKSPATQKRIAIVIEYMTYRVWKYVIRGLYEVDKPVFSLLLALKIDLKAGKIRHEEFQCFVKGGASLDLNTVRPKPFKWITDMTWLHLVALSNLNQFSNLLDQVAKNDRAWRHWLDKNTPETEHLPDGYQNSVDAFRRLLLIRAWCPDRVMDQANNYVNSTLGSRFSEGFVLDIEGVFMESTPRWPMVGLLSMGSDPTMQIELLAKKFRLDCRTISMGQGQEVHARRLLASSVNAGGWVILQNCHLSLNYMIEVLNQLTDAEQLHDAFRLWVTTEVNTHFPISFLQTSVKFTNEPPQGIKASLKRTYGSFTQDFLDISNLPQWKPMVFAVSFLHTTVQERRQYGPLGWNIPYEFNTSDLNASLQFVQNHLDELNANKGIDWKCVRYMLGEIQYGGRVTDDFDKRLLVTYCKRWFQESLFNPDFMFATEIPMPPVMKLQDTLGWINELPPTHSPNVFGLHENANIVYQSKRVKTILDCILNIQPKDASAGAGETREDVVLRMADDMLSKLPPDYVPFEVSERLAELGALQPMNIFLRQELERIQRLLSLVRTCLTELRLAIDGTIVMSESLREALDFMYDARIPASWIKLSWDSSTLGFWFTELVERNHQYSEWLHDGRPSCFWMTGFFNPQGFLTAIRQEVTRSHKGWALDTVILWNEVMKVMRDDINRPPPEGAYVYGLFLEGADFDRRNLRLSEAKPRVLYEPMPVIHIQALDVAKDKEFAKDRLNDMYICPVYKKPRRTDLTYVASFYLRCPPTKPPDHWILRGTALLCDIR